MQTFDNDYWYTLVRSLVKKGATIRRKTTPPELKPDALPAARTVNPLDRSTRAMESRIRPPSVYIRRKK